MDQQLSRPERWQGAVNRAGNALARLQDLHTQWAVKLEELRDELSDLCAQRSAGSAELDDALADLVCLQSEYDSWNVPDNLSQSRLQEKLFDVQGFNFKELRDSISRLRKFALEDVLEDAAQEASVASIEEPLEGAVLTLHEAREFDLPKGWGRD